MMNINIYMLPHAIAYDIQKAYIGIPHGYTTTHIRWLEFICSISLTWTSLPLCKPRFIFLEWTVMKCLIKPWHKRKPKYLYGAWVLYGEWTYNHESQAQNITYQSSGDKESRSVSFCLPACLPACLHDSSLLVTGQDNIMTWLTYLAMFFCPIYFENAHFLQATDY